MLAENKELFLYSAEGRQEPPQTPHLSVCWRGEATPTLTTEKNEHGNDSLFFWLHQHSGWPCRHPPSSSRRRPGPGNGLAAVSGLKQTAATAACGPRTGHTRLEWERPSQHPAKGGGDAFPRQTNGLAGTSPVALSSPVARPSPEHRML